MHRPIAGVYAAIGQSDRDTDVRHDVWTAGHKESVLTPLLYRMRHFCARHPVWVLAVWLVVALTIVGVVRRPTTTSRCQVPTARRPATFFVTSSLSRPTARSRSLSGLRPVQNSPIPDTRSR